MRNLSKSVLSMKSIEVVAAVIERDGKFSPLSVATANIRIGGNFREAR